MFEKFADGARQVIVRAQEEARRLDHDSIGTEHLLLGLIGQSEGVAGQVMESLGIELEAVRQQLEEIIGPGQRPPKEHIPFTPRAKKVLELSLREALQLGHDYIGSEHILLGLLCEGEGVAAQVLVGRGADLDRAREMVAGLVPRVRRGRTRRAARPAGDEPSETDRLREEVARLRRLLYRHGIDPDAATDSTG